MGNEINIRQIASPTQRYFLYQMQSDYGSSCNSVFSYSYSWQMPSFGEAFRSSLAFGLGAGLVNIGLRFVDRLINGKNGDSSYTQNYNYNYGGCFGGGYTPYTQFGLYGGVQAYPQMNYGGFGLYTPQIPAYPTTPAPSTAAAPSSSQTPASTSAETETPAESPAETESPAPTPQTRTESSDAANEDKAQAQKPAQAQEQKPDQEETRAKEEPSNKDDEKTKTNADLKDINDYKSRLKVLKAQGGQAKKEDIQALYNNINAKKANLDNVDDDKDIKSLNKLAKKVSKLYVKYFREDLVTHVAKPKKKIRDYANAALNFAKRVPEFFTKKDEDKAGIKDLQSQVESLTSESSPAVVLDLYKKISSYKQQDDKKKNTNNYQIERLKHKVEKFAHEHNIRLVEQEQEQE